MSGPKGGHYQLVRTPAGELYRVAAARAMLANYREAIDRCVAEMEALGRPCVLPPLDTALDAGGYPDQAWASRVERELRHRQAAVTNLRDAVSRAKAEDAARRLAEAEAARLAEAAGRMVASRDVRATADAERETVGRAELAKRVAGALSTLDASIAEADLSQLREFAAACVTAEAHAAELLFTDLRVRVDKANRAHREAARRAAEQRVAEAAEARAFMLKLAEVARPASGQLAKDLVAVIMSEAPLSESLRSEAAKAVEDAKREFAHTALTDSLMELGYQIGEPFETTLAATGHTFQREEWGDYHANLRLDPDSQRLSVHMVRAGEPGDQADADQLAADHTMEGEWCSEMPALLERLREKGLEVELSKRMDPGALPVQVIRAPRRAAKRSVRTSSAPTVAARSIPLKR
jgi:hypothetical protein